MLFSDGPIKAVELVPDSCRASGTENGNWTRTDVTEDSLKKFQRRTDNTMAKRKMKKGQTTIYKTLHIKRRKMYNLYELYKQVKKASL
jgi:uncharacterized Rmd1/YagE family protein